MKIALVILHADPARGGAERYTVDLAEALARRGHEVSLLASSFSRSVAESLRQPIDAKGFTRTGRYRSFLDHLDRHLAQTHYDVVHAMLPMPRCDIYHPHAGMAVEQMEKGNRLVNPRRRLMADVERELLAGDHPPIVIALSDYVKRSILKSYPLPDDRLATVFNAAALNYFDPSQPNNRQGVRDGRGIADDEVVALIVAQDFERKGVPQAIEAVRRINVSRPASQPRLRLLIVGAGHKPEIKDDIIFAGISSKVVCFYAAADFFVLPTKHDPCSLVVLEALAMGLPVISTVYNGATEIMTDGVHGYVLPDPNDVDALADAMRKMLDPQQRAQMSRACLELRPRLSYETHLDRLLEIYERAMKTRNA